MTPEQKAADIKRGHEIKKLIAELETELKAIEARLQADALAGPHVPLEDAEREGKQRIIETPTHRLRIRIESDNLVGGFEVGSDLEKDISAMITAEQFNALFKRVEKYERKEKDGHKFRLKAKKALNDQPLYHKFIRALRSLDSNGIAKSKIVIPWNEIEELEPVTNRP